MVNIDYKRDPALTGLSESVVKVRHEIAVAMLNKLKRSGVNPVYEAIRTKINAEIKKRELAGTATGTDFIELEQKYLETKEYKDLLQTVYQAANDKVDNWLHTGKWGNIKMTPLIWSLNIKPHGVVIKKLANDMELMRLQGPNPKMKRGRKKTKSTQPKRTPLGSGKCMNSQITFDIWNPETKYMYKIKLS
jgi:hypothetical protein